MAIPDKQLLTWSRAANKARTIPLTTAVSLTQRTVHAFTPEPDLVAVPGNTPNAAQRWVFAQAMLWCRTVAGAVAIMLFRVFADSVLASPGLAIDATPEKFKLTNAFGFRANKIYGAKAATNALVFSANYVINGANKWGAFRVQMDSAGVVSTKGALANAFLTENLAFAALPAPDAGKISLGHITVEAKNATWTANTDDMTNGSDCVVAHFTSALVSAGAVPLLSANLVPSASAEVLSTPVDTFSNRQGAASDQLAVVLTTDGTGAMADALLTVITRPFPLNGDAG